MKNHKEYIERSDLKDATHLELNVYYTKDDIHLLSGEPIPRDYYVSVNPAIFDKGMFDVLY